MMEAGQLNQEVGWRVKHCGAGPLWLEWMDGQRHAGGTPAQKWTVNICKYAPKQDDGYNCGIFTIANAVAIALGELDCGTINPDAWRKWLALEIIALGVRQGVHKLIHLLPDEGKWEEMFKGQ